MSNFDQKIKERMDNVVVRHYFKPWHKRFWGRALIVLAAIFVLVFIFFIYKVAFSFVHIRKGDIWNREVGVWVSPEQFKTNQEAIANLITDDDPWLGAKDPLIFIVAYDSMACPFSKADQPEIKKMLAEFGSTVRFVVKDFPTEGLHPNVFEAHLASGCANEQGKYWEYRDLLFANQGNFKRDNLKVLAKQLGLDNKKFDECLNTDKYNQEIRQDYAGGVQADVIGTPSYVINGNLIPGAISFDNWKKIIGYILKEGYK